MAGLFEIPKYNEKKRNMREEEGGLERLISSKGHEADMKKQKSSYMGNTPTIESAAKLYLENGRQIRPVDTGSNENTSIMSVAISKLGDKTAFGCSCGSVYYTDASRTSQKINRFPTSGFTNAVAFTNDGTNIIAGTNKGMLIFDTDTGISTQIISEGQQWVTSIAVHPTRDDIFVVGYYNRGAIKIFWLTDGKWTLFDTRTHGLGTVGFDAVNSVVFSPNGTHFYSGGSDGMVNVWDFGRRAPVRTIVHIDGPGSFATVNSLVITTEHIISAGGDGVIKVWGKSNGALTSSTICESIGGGRGYSINDMAFANGMLAVVVERWGADHPSAGDNVFLYYLNAKDGVLTFAQKFRGPTPFKSVAIGPYYGIGETTELDDLVVKAGGTGGFIIRLVNRGSRLQRHLLKKGLEASDEEYAAAAAEGRSLASADAERGEFAVSLARLPEELRKEIIEHLGGKRTKRRRKQKQKRTNKKSLTSKRR